MECRIVETSSTVCQIAAKCPASNETIAQSTSVHHPVSFGHLRDIYIVVTTREFSENKVLNIVNVEL